MTLPASLADELIRSLDSAESERPGLFLHLGDIESVLRSLNHPIPDELSTIGILEELIRRDWIESDGAGASISTHGFRITAKGQNRAAASQNPADQFSRAMEHSPLTSESADDISGPISGSGFGVGAFGMGTFAGPTGLQPDDVVQAVTSTSPSVTSGIHSKRWTGTQFVLVDGEILTQIRAEVKHLHHTIHAMHIENNADSQDLKGLADALLAVCTMAEPEVTLLDRILASPKFRTYSALFGIVAMIRGAIGI